MPGSTARLPAPPMYVDEWMSHTIVGVVLLGVELGLATARFVLALILPVGWSIGSAGLFAAVGFVAFLTTWRAMTDPHRLSVAAGISLGALAVAIYLALPIILGVPNSNNGYVAQAGATRIGVLTGCLAVPVALAALGIASFALQDRVGRMLLGVGIAGAVVASALLWSWLNPALDAALAEALANHNLYPFWDFTALWARLGSVYAVPAGVLLVAYERLYWQLRRRHRALRGTPSA